jgi:hypothetical protein
MKTNSNEMPLRKLVSRYASTFKGHPPYPPVIEEQEAATCERLRTMERELAGGSQ